MAKSFFHDEQVYTNDSAREIVPLLIQMVQPTSVIDVGCGIGNFLSVFVENGISDITGLDGPWVDRAQLAKYIALRNFTVVDLEKGLGDYIAKSQRRYDLVISLEVAEHLSSKHAEKFVGNLCALGDTIVFSGAAPFQDGENHINEQWPSYWMELFRKHNFQCHDLIRPKIWDNPKIHWWYRQNILCFKRGPVTDNVVTTSPFGVDLVHPENYLVKAEWIQAIKTGKISWGFMFLLFKNIVKQKLKWKKTDLP